MRRVVLIAHDIRSAHNIGSLMRTAEGLGVERMIISGFSPYPAVPDDVRLPHIARKVSQRVLKTSLGAEISLNWEHKDDINQVISDLKDDGFRLVALEQASGAKTLEAYKPGPNVALVLGGEKDGISQDVLQLCDDVIEIPMSGQKESFNVAAAAAMALFYLINIG